MTSVPSISRLLMRAWAPVSCIVGTAFGGGRAGDEQVVGRVTSRWSGVSGRKKPPALARGERTARESGVRYVSTTRRSAAIRMDPQSA